MPPVNFACSESGATGFPSVFGGHAVEPGLGNKLYVLTYNRSSRRKGKEDLLALEDKPKPIDDDGFVVLPLGAPEPKPKPKRAHAPGRGHAGGSGGRGKPSGSGGDGGVVPPLPVPPVVGGGGPVAPPTPEEEGGEEFVVVPLPAAADAARPPKDKPNKKYDTVPGLNGCMVSYQEPDESAPNYRLTCPIKCHGSCWKSRGCNPEFKAMFGAVEPLLYLHARASLPKPADATHRSLNPTPEQVRAFAADHMAEMQEIFAQVHPLVPP